MKKTIVDYITQQEVDTISTSGANVESVSSFKHIGVHVTKDFSWSLTRKHCGQEC